MRKLSDVKQLLFLSVRFITGFIYLSIFFFNQHFVLVALAFLLYQEKQMPSELLQRSQAFQCELPSKLRYLWFPSIVLSNQCQTIFTLKEPNQSPFSCQQQLPWQHTGRSTLWEQDTSLERAMRRTFCTSCSIVCTHVCMRVGVLLE